MTLHVSTGLRNAAMDSNPVITTMTGGFIFLYEGIIPDSADDLIDPSVSVLAKISVDGDGVTGLSFLPTATGGTITKADEVWKSNSGTTQGGTVSFYRHIVDATDVTEEGFSASTVYPRLQGAVGSTIEELIMSDPNISTGAEQAINFYSVTFPTS